jgi:hypothetical protein
VFYSLGVGTTLRRIAQLCSKIFSDRSRNRRNFEPRFRPFRKSNGNVTFVGLYRIGMYERYTRRCPTSFFVEKAIKRLPTASADFLDLGIWASDTNQLYVFASVDSNPAPDPGSQRRRARYSKLFSATRSAHGKPIGT